MKWVKKGLIYAPNASFFWNQSHAQVPTPIYISQKEIIRVYYSTRDKLSRSYISFVDVDANNPDQILYTHNEPILSPGKLGAFDDCGVMPSWIVFHNNQYYLYYIGWNVRNTVPYYNSIGLAVSDDGITYRRFSDGPLFDRNYKEPYFSASSCVLIDNGVWKMWYLSCTGYYEVLGKIEPRYHIKYAESKNGIDWERDGIVCIDYKNDEEAGIVKASVVKIKDVYYMWYSYRNFKNYRTDQSNSYKIGFAISKDGITWDRLDEQVGISISVNSWDSNMLAYPHVVDHKGVLILFYNGNDFGKYGFGLAINKQYD